MSANGQLTAAEQLAWFAGWFEGEGCFHVGRRRDGRPRFLVTAGSTDRDVIDKAARIAGVGKVRSAPHHQGVKPMWVWRVDRRTDVLALAKRLRPYMGERRSEKIDEMLAVGNAEPPVVVTAEDRTARARKMWAGRRKRYGPNGMKAAA